MRSSFGLQSPSSNQISNAFSARNSGHGEEYEEKWATIERIEIGNIRLLHGGVKEEGFPKERNVSKLGALEKGMFIDSLIQHIEDDNLRLLQKQKERIERVGIKFPTIEVKYENLTVEAECEVVEGKPLPTLWNTAKSFFLSLVWLPWLRSQREKIKIVRDVSGVIRPSRMTLLLGPPGCGKTTFLQALSGKLDKSLKVTGEVSYNGLRLEEFVPAKTSSYISQYDLHVPQMTVRETLDYSARFQGIGNREEIMKEVRRREKQAGIVPDPDIDTYMKAISVEGLERSLQTDYILKIMGLDICAEIIVGDAMTRGISGGQKKRLTTGEMIVGPTRALFMDQISNGLDSTTTFQIVKCLQQLAHITEATLLVSLLQLAPETYDLFDDIILMAEGKIVYHGPRDQILSFFEECGFKCPERKGTADFLQEVLSRRDQEQYWCHKDKPYSYISIDFFSKTFKSHEIGRDLKEKVSEFYKISDWNKNALSFSTYSLSRWELFKACLSREYLLMRRNSFIYISKTIQLMIVACVLMTVFFRTRMRADVFDANYYMGSMFYSLNFLIWNAFPELAITVSRLPVFFKQRECHFYPSWAYAIPTSILKIPLSLVGSFIWTAMTYYVIGYSPEPERFFCHFILLFCLHQMALSLFRFLAGFCQTVVAGVTSGILIFGVMLLFGGFVLSKPSLPSWLSWGFWLSPISYAEIAISINEFLSPRWEKISPTGITMGKQLLISRGLDYPSYFFWISVGALIGFSILFNIGFALSLSYFNGPGRSPHIISWKKLAELRAQEQQTTENKKDEKSDDFQDSDDSRKYGKMILPFEPLTVTFQSVQYYVDTPQEMKEKLYTEKRLQLLHDITGVFRPGVLTALMGVSGAGKTTLMDVLCGRKTAGHIEGDIRIGGYPKVQATFARISGYCEQTDIHSPQITVEESLMYSAWLRLPPEIDPKTRAAFVNEVLETIELMKIKDSMVGIAGVNGLSTEQRKRLTIAVELVSNPSIIFMDEPTSGLDARSAAIIMRSVRNVSETGRTVVCTIHQPSIDVFEAFDELILMKRGGQLIYAGNLGRYSKTVIEYFEGISGVPRIKDNHNPATWMLDVTSTTMEMKLGVDFSQIYKESSLYKENLDLVQKYIVASQDSKELHFPSIFPQNFWVQLTACLWKQNLAYWRNPKYNLTRLASITVLSIALAAVFWQHGKTLNNQQDLFNILGSMYTAVMFLGIIKCSSVQPIIAVERNVLSRETFAGMYSSWAYAFSQMAIEIPYIFAETAVFMVITYPGIGFYSSSEKFFWFFYTMFCTLLYFNYLGMFIVSATPNLQMASVIASTFYSMMSLFSGYIVPGKEIPKWWIWLYHAIPTSWTLNGLFTSQYGDIEKEITVFGDSKSIKSFINDYFGFSQSQLPLVFVLLLLYPLFFGSLFSVCIGKINFQRR